MTSFTRTWDAAYEALPANSQDARLGASRIREIKEDIRERMDVGHTWNGDANDGQYHRAPLYILDTTGTVNNYLNVVKNGSWGDLHWGSGAVGQSLVVEGEWSGYPIGGILTWVSTLPPKGGWLYCDGTVYNTATYPRLFARIGSTWGGNGTTTFAVPDFRGRVLAGVDGGTGRLSGVITNGLAQSGGNQWLQVHDHTFSGTTSSNGAHSHTYSVTTFSGSWGGGAFGALGSGLAPASTSSDGAHTHIYSGTVTATGAGGSQNVQPTTQVYFYIRCDG